MRAAWASQAAGALSAEEGTRPFRPVDWSRGGYRSIHRSRHLPRLHETGRPPDHTRALRGEPGGQDPPASVHRRHPASATAQCNLRSRQGHRARPAGDDCTRAGRAMEGQTQAKGATAPVTKGIDVTSAWEGSLSHRLFRLRDGPPPDREAVGHASPDYRLQNVSKTGEDSGGLTRAAEDSGDDRGR